MSCASARAHGHASCQPAIGDTQAVQFNDGKCDRYGRFWVGTMDRAEREPLGSLYRGDADGTIIAVLDAIITSNGHGWSPDDRTMYHTDSWTYTITAYDFDPVAAELANGRVFAQDDPTAHTAPDGLTVDAEGGVWSATWDGWRMVRYRPDGAIDRVVAMARCAAHLPHFSRTGSRSSVHHHGATGADAGRDRRSASCGKRSGRQAG